MKVLVGADAEGCLINRNNNLAACSVYRCPEKIDLKEKAATSSAWAYHDGFNFEFGIRPEESIDRLISNVRDGILEATKMAESLGFDILFGDGHEIDMDDVRDKKGWDVSGCNPTRNPFNGFDEVPAFPDYGEFMASVGTLMGCHLHFGCEELEKLRANGPTILHDRIARILTLVIPEMIRGYLDLRDFDTRWVRTRFEKLGVGNYRIPFHGFEYKDPGSIILMHPMTFATIAVVGRALVTACLLDHSWAENRASDRNLVDVYRAVTSKEVVEFCTCPDILAEAMEISGINRTTDKYAVICSGKRLKHNHDPWMVCSDRDRYVNGCMSIENLFCGD